MLLNAHVSEGVAVAFRLQLKSQEPLFVFPPSGVIASGQKLKVVREFRVAHPLCRLGSALALSAPAQFRTLRQRQALAHWSKVHRIDFAWCSR